MSNGHEQAEAKYRVYFDHTAYRKMKAYTKYAKGEVGGMGLVDEKAGHIHIADTFIVPQSATSSSVEYNTKAFSKLIYQKVKAGDKKFPERLRMVWHSHASMQCFHSCTDEDTVNLMLQSSPYVLSVVVNKKGGCDISLVFKKPLKVVVKHVEFVMTYNDNLEAKCRKEVEKMVKQEPENVYVHYDTSYHQKRAGETLDDWQKRWRERMGFGKAQRDLGPSEEEVEARLREDEADRDFPSIGNLPDPPKGRGNRRHRSRKGGGR